jgi:hypothetical protein
MRCLMAIAKLCWQKQMVEQQESQLHSMPFMRASQMHDK